MRAVRLALLIPALLPVVAPTPAAACTTVSGYRVPTNFEMVEQADTILLGVVERGPLPRSGDRSALVIRPTLLLKGPALPAEVRIEGTLSGDFPTTVSDPDELERAHPDAYAGACSRYMFVQGSTVLLFFTRENGVMRRFSPVFSRSAEDVPGPNSRWVQAVRLYVEIAALPPAERRAALFARRDSLAARIGDADAQAIAADIERYLRAVGAIQ